LEDAGVKASGETQAGVAGEAAKAIVDEAKRFGADLIVMGSRGLSDLPGPARRQRRAQGAPLRALPGADRALTFRARDPLASGGARLKLNARQWRLYDPVNMAARGWRRGRRAD
jgi:hypothetical protein